MLYHVTQQSLSVTVRHVTWGDLDYPGVVHVGRHKGRGYGKGQKSMVEGSVG